MFGDYFLVAPVYSDNLTGKINLPQGRWRYFFDDRKVLTGPVTFEREFPLDEYPVFIREGAIIPMNIERQYTGIGDKDSEGYLTLLIYPEGKSEFTVHHTDKSGFSTIMAEDSADELKISFQGVHKPHILNINMHSAPLNVELDGKKLSYPEDFKYDARKHKLIIKTSQYEDGIYTIRKQVQQAMNHSLKPVN